MQSNVISTADPHDCKASRMRGFYRWLIACLVLLAATIGDAVAESGSDAGLALPRFVSLAADTINVRTGPGKNYPIAWVYARLGLPVKIVAVEENWRKIEDQDGQQGWIHGSLLSRRRTAVLVDKVRELRRSASADARVVLRAEPGVVGRLLDCSANWCFLEIDGKRGWLERDGIWGILPEEMNR